MYVIKILIGAMTGVLLANALAADPIVRPQSRDDGRQAHRVASADLMAGYRVTARPLHMIRYPVTVQTSPPTVRPVARSAYLPKTRWDHQPGSAVWTRAAMAAVGVHEGGLITVVPRDIGQWCPAYTQNTAPSRRAFWVGMMSALAKYESTYNPRAVGGGNRWFGLLQIFPDTARRYGCRARTGEALKNPVENLSCAARIMAVTVRRDRAIALNDRGWRGVAADWGPMRTGAKRAEMAAWTRQQSYCQTPTQVRPQTRPAQPISAGETRP